ncbi:uncharacterized protein SPAPADRAFT_49735 [Spathaspora passalidarum NRRL Y-27907]|uniref:Protein BIG1 n=1 Tax=Spathaspora passalidarum (strain NRRL Y-27907 / 11-Y1) TaxID=619300 RepID=G3AMD6_SPAPN|nr:uncharacterized protein SPAPADRAFT_49735 [Spathaspora passalidarum NRRL Y-27907]EGW32789.1 hypothetical protein SPAPADRAFT_49735 [Spathaspora passalidarum NRRL Y-27907]
MKVQSLSLIASVLSVVNAFADTALLYSSFDLEVPHKYITESKDLSQFMLQYIQQLCANDKQLYIYRVNQLKSSQVDHGVLLNHVHYNSISDLSFPIDAACSLEIVSEQDSNQSQSNIVVVEVSEGVHSIDEFLKHENVIVQGVPSFHKRNKVNQIVEQVNDMFHDDVEKRDVADGSNYDDIQSEVEADFREAESLIDDETVTVFKASIKEARASNDTKKSTNTSLFTNYQFFTPGIWSGIIVSGFLLTILYLGINWLNSLEVTYSSFEKQVDYDKKNE